MSVHPVFDLDRRWILRNGQVELREGGPFYRRSHHDHLHHQRRFTPVPLQGPHFQLELNACDSRTHIWTRDWQMTANNYYNLLMTIIEWIDKWLFFSLGAILFEFTNRDPCYVIVDCRLIVFVKYHRHQYNPPLPPPPPPHHHNHHHTRMYNYHCCFCCCCCCCYSSRHSCRPICVTDFETEEAEKL